ncbi:MAG TPA: hypothetical protein VJB93_01540 [Patescibacteria group bacterium]|nr:hypothetical protein [Patescibacteria group bacterium]
MYIPIWWLLRKLKEERRERGCYSKEFKIAIWLAPLLFAGLFLLYVYFVEQ